MHIASHTLTLRFLGFIGGIIVLLIAWKWKTRLIMHLKTCTIKEKSNVEFSRNTSLTFWWHQWFFVGTIYGMMETLEDMRLSKGVFF